MESLQLKNQTKHIPVYYIEDHFDFASNITLLKIECSGKFYVNIKMISKLGTWDSVFADSVFEIQCLLEIYIAVSLRH